MTESDPVFRILWELHKLGAKCDMEPPCQSGYAQLCYKIRSGEISPHSDSEPLCDCLCHVVPPMRYGNSEHYPAKQDPNPECNDDRVKRALSDLESSKPRALKEVKKWLSALDEEKAYECLTDHFPLFPKTMRPVMKEKLFELITGPLGNRERARRIMRKLSPKSFRAIFSDEALRQELWDEFAKNKILVPT